MKLRKSFFTLFLLIPLSLYPQSKIDSLIRISTTQKGIEQLHTQLQIAEDFAYGENGDTIIYYASRCHQQAKELHDSLSLLKSTLLWSSGLFSKKKYHESIEKADAFFLLAEQLNQKEEIVKGLYLKAKNYQRLHDYQKAIELYQKGYLSVMQILSIQKDAHMSSYCKAILKQLTYCYWYASESLKGIAFFQDLMAKNAHTSDDLTHAYYSNIAFLYSQDIDMQLAEKYQIKAMEMSQATSNRNDQFQDLSYLGSLYYSKGEYKKAIDYYQKSLQIAKQLNNTNMISYVSTNLGSSYEKTGDLKAGVSLLYEGIELFQNRKDSVGIGIGYQNLGALMLKWNNYRDAKTYLKKALLCNQKLGLQNKVLTNTLDLAIVCLQNNEKDSCQFYLRSLKKQLPHCNSKKLIANYHCYKALSILKFGSEPSQAVENAKTALRTANSLQSKPLIALANLSLGKSYQKMDSLLLAKKFISTSWKAYKSMNLLYERANASKSLSLTYNKMNEPDSAYYYLTETEKIHSEIRKRDQILALYKKDNDFTVQLTQKEKDLLTRKNKQLFNRIFLIRSFYISLLLLLSGFLLFFRSKRNKKLRLLLHKKELAKEQLRQKYNLHQTNLIRSREQIQTKENTIRELKAQLQQNQLSQSDPEEFNEIECLLSSRLSTEEDWDNYLQCFTKRNPYFISNLKNRYPDLSRNEIKIFLLTKLELTTREMAGILMISPSSVNTARYRLRKKINLEPSEKLEDIVSELKSESKLELNLQNPG